MTDETIDDTVDTLFEGEEQPEIKTEVVETEDKPEESGSEQKGETEDGEPDSTSETPAETEKPKLIPIAAVLDERRKRQQLQEENARLREQIPASDEAPDPYDDIDAYNAYMKNQWETEAFQKQERERFGKIEASRSVLLEQHDDFVEMEKIFELMVAADPSLAEKRMTSGDEPKFAYEQAKAYKESLLGKPAESPAPSEAEERLKSAIESPNLAAATAVGSNTQPIEQEEDLMEIFGDQAY